MLCLLSSSFTAFFSVCVPRLGLFGVSPSLTVWQQLVPSPCLQENPPHGPCPYQNPIKPPGERVPTEPAVLAQREPKALGFGVTSQLRLQGTRQAPGAAPAFSGGAAGAVGCLWPAPAGRPCVTAGVWRGTRLRKSLGACGLVIGAEKRRAKRDRRTWGCGHSEPGGGWGQL